MAIHLLTICTSTGQALMILKGKDDLFHTYDSKALNTCINSLIFCK